MSANLLTEIEQFLAETGMSASRFGLRAARNSRLVERLRERVTKERGKPVRVWPETEQQVREFIRAHRKRRSAAPTEKALAS